MSENKGVSPYGENGKLTETTTFTIEDGTDDGAQVTMTVDISLDGNTGGVTFTQKGPIATVNPASFFTGTSIPVITEDQDIPVGGKLLETIKNDNNGVVASNYNSVIEKTKEKIIENGGDVTVFEESLLDNKNTNVSGALENYVKKDLNNDGVVGSNTSEGGDNNEPEEFKAPQFGKDQNFRYPLDIQHGDGDGPSQDYIFLEQFSYLPPNPLTGDRLTDRGKKMNDEKESINTVDKVVKFGVRRSNNIKEAFGTCILPIPNKLGVSNGVSWGEARANSVELGAFGAASNTISDQLKEVDIGKLFTKGVEGIGDTFNKLKKEMQEGESPNARDIISGTLAKSVLGQIGINVDIDQFITRQTGAAINPNLELLFGGPQLRTFSFAFDFAPNSDKEADMVRKIQRWFKQGMLPSRSGVKGARKQSLFLGSPNVFRIAYMNKSRRIKGLNIIKICALTSCQIDFTPDNTYQSYEDTSAFSQPVRSTMALTFNELTPIFRDDYGDDENSGFARDPSLEDLDTNITGDNSISDTDIGF